MTTALLAVTATGATASEVTPADRSSLELMREEEKLARDAYIALGDRWDLQQLYDELVEEVDIEAVYERLLAGSHNHLRAFVAQRGRRPGGRRGRI